MRPIVLDKCLKFRDPCLNCNSRPEVYNDVISGEALDYVGVDVHVKFGESRSSRSRDIRGPDFVSNELT